MLRHTFSSNHACNHACNLTPTFLTALSPAKTFHHPPTLPGCSENDRFLLSATADSASLEARTAYTHVPVVADEATDAPVLLDVLVRPDTDNASGYPPGGPWREDLHGVA